MYFAIILGAIIIFIFFILPILQHSYDYGKEKVEEINNKVEQHREIKRMEQDAVSQVNLYNEKKNTFRYLSDKMLLELYENKKEKASPYYLLALEETLVERKLISHSPTHEKLEKLENFFLEE